MAADRYSRQSLFLGREAQDCVAASRVTLVGCGALGSNIANLLARAGVGRLRIVDRDFVELDNLQRQVLFDEEDVRSAMPKAAAAARRLAAINSSVAVEPVVADVTYANVEGLVADADAVLDGTDNFETRFVLNDACVKHGKPWVYGGCVGSYGMVLPVLPGETACLRCWLQDLPAPGSSPTCDTAGVLNTAAGIIASLQSNEAIKILAGRRDVLARGLTVLDVWSNTWQTLSIPRVPDCPACGRRDFPFLAAKDTGTATSLCGRNAVQVSPPAATIDLAELERRLAPAGKVRRNEFLVRFEVESYELTIFPDGRAIVKGTSDPARARALYARYIGS